MKKAGESNTITGPFPRNVSELFKGFASSVVERGSSAIRVCALVCCCKGGRWPCSRRRELDGVSSYHE